MKLTKSTIIQLIKEEIQSTLKEASWRVRGRLRKKVNAACFKGGVVTKRGIRKLKVVDAHRIPISPMKILALRVKQRTEAMPQRSINC